jgi:predicted amidohydrolase YtcJ
VAIVVTISACAPSPRLPADIVITRANIWTGDPARPAAAALAIVGDRVIAIGDTGEIAQFTASRTTVIDAEQRSVVPGFHARVHVVDGGIALDRVDLRDAETPREFARRIAERARKRPGEWILGGEWDSREWRPPDPPTRQLVDDATNGTPVFVRRADDRMALANSAALGRAGITERTPDPPRGAIQRDARRFPTGILTGSAMAIVERVIPKLTIDERERAAKRALQYAATLGVTHLEDINPTPDDVGVYTRLANRRELSVRISTANERGTGQEWPKSPLNPMLTLTTTTIAARTGGDVLAPGKTADLVMLSDDILGIPSERIKRVGVLVTIVGGKIVHQRNP